MGKRNRSKRISGSGTGAVIFAVLFIWKRQKEGEDQKKRKDLLLRDYPGNSGAVFPADRSRNDRERSME